MQRALSEREADEYDDRAEEDGEALDSMLDLQMEGMRVTEEAWPVRSAALPLPPTLPATTKALPPPPPLASEPVDAVSAPVTDARLAVLTFAGFGEAPTSLLAMPGYALRVLARKRILRRDLALARARNSADVGLYEDALTCANATAVRAGWALLALAPVLLGVFVFMLLTLCFRD